MLVYETQCREAATVVASIDISFVLKICKLKIDIVNLLAT